MSLDLLATIPLDSMPQDLVFALPDQVELAGQSLIGAPGSRIAMSGFSAIFDESHWRRATNVHQIQFCASVTGTVSIAATRRSHGHEETVAEHHVDARAAMDVALAIDLVDAGDACLFIRFHFHGQGTVTRARWMTAAPRMREPVLAIVLMAADAGGGRPHPAHILATALAQADRVSLGQIIIVDGDEQASHLLADATPVTGGLTQGLRVAIAGDASHVLVLAQVSFDAAMLDRLCAILRHANDDVAVTATCLNLDYSKQAHPAGGSIWCMALPCETVRRHGLPLPLHGGAGHYARRIGQSACWPGLIVRAPRTAQAWQVFYDTRDALFSAELRGGGRATPWALTAQFFAHLLQYDYRRARALVGGLAAFNAGPEALCAWTMADHARIVAQSAPAYRPTGQRFPPLRTRLMQSRRAGWRTIAALLLDLFAPFAKLLIRRGFIREEDLGPLLIPRPRLILVRGQTGSQIEQRPYEWRRTWRLTLAFARHCAVYLALRRSQRAALQALIRVGTR